MWTPATTFSPRNVQLQKGKKMNNKKDSTIQIMATNSLFHYLTEKLSRKTQQRLSKLQAYCDLLDKTSKGYVSDFLKNSDYYPQDHQCHVTLSEIAIDWRWHRATVRSFLEELQKFGQLTLQRLDKSVVITMPVPVNNGQAQNDTATENFDTKLSSLLYKWQTDTIDDKELVQGIEQLVRQKKDSSDEVSDDNALAKPMETSSEVTASPESMARQSDVDSKIEKVIDALAVAIFVKAIRKGCPDNSTPMTHFLHEDCRDNWTSFLNTLSSVTEFIITNSSALPESEREISLLCSSLRAFIAERLS